MRVEILDRAFDPWQEVVRHGNGVAEGEHGATAVFVGTMRDFNEGEPVREMRLEHYDKMTQAHLEALSERTVEEFGLIDLLMLHRVGRIVSGEPIVLVAVWSAHRAQAFEACERMVEDLKSKAPFWKKETLRTGETRWVENNTASRRSIYEQIEENEDG